MNRLGAADDPDLREVADATLALDGLFRSDRAAELAARAGRGGRGRRSHPRTPGELPAIEISDARMTEQLPGHRARSTPQGPVGDPAVDEAWAGLEATLRFLAEQFDRDGLDGDGSPLRATVHFGVRYLNAFWDGERMVFGDGDGVLFRRFTGAVDVIAHELGHGLIADEARLAYVYEPGALNESLADVFGSLVKQHHLGQAAHEADWLIGDALLTDRVRGQALRSMAAPGTAYDDPVLGRDPQPGHMQAFVRTREDNGGVHLNSGIPNRAFHLAATGIGGPAWEGAGRIWYDALLDPAVTPATDFAHFARLTEAAAARRYGAESRAWLAVREAWRRVGIDPSPSAERPMPWLLRPTAAAASDN